MSDWAEGSARMKWLAAAGMATWLASGAFSLVASDTAVKPAFASAVLFVSALLIAGLVVAWSAMQSHRSAVHSAAWLLLGVGLLAQIVVFTATIVAAMAVDRSASPFGAALEPSVWGYPPVVGAMFMLAWSLRGVPKPGQALWRSLSLSLVIWSALLAALIAPGPSMPFSIGPRDTTAMIRLTVDMLFVFWPATYSVAATLQGPGGHRARSWMWVAIGALAWAMSDVGLPLVDLHHAQAYPLLLWALGVQIMAMGASLAVDLDIAETQTTEDAANAKPKPAGALD